MTDAAKSDTPLTDAAIKIVMADIGSNDNPHFIRSEYVSSDFARQMERDANNALKALAELRAKHSDVLEPHTADTERLFHVCEHFDGLGDGDFHERASIVAERNGREEPARADYLTAYREVVDEVMATRVNSFQNQRGSPLCARNSRARARADRQHRRAAFRSGRNARRTCDQAGAHVIAAQRSGVEIRTPT